MLKLSKNQQSILTDEQIENFAGFFDILEHIHHRLIIENYVIKNKNASNKYAKIWRAYA
jgi:hypothetical protein